MIDLRMDGNKNRYLAIIQTYKNDILYYNFDRVMSKDIFQVILSQTTGDATSHVVTCR